MVAVLRIVPPGDNVALEEMVWRALSASLTPHRVFGGGDARRKLARRASRWTRAVWGLLLAIPSSLAVVPAKDSVLTPPQDRENCHAGGNAFILFDGFEPVTFCNLCL